MNCPQCGHDASEHDAPAYKRVGVKLIGCRNTKADIELAAWKAEALAAREYIDYLYKNRIWGMDESELEGHENHYLAARVKDDHS